MAAPVIAAIEQQQVPEGHYQQVFIPYFIPVSPPVQSNAEGDAATGDAATASEYGECMWALPYMMTYDAACASWSYHDCRFPQQGHPVKKIPVLPGASCSRRSDGEKHEGLTADSVIILLSNLPKKFCSRAFIETALEQAHLETVVQTFEVLRDKGQAVLALTNEAAAQRVIKHFEGLKWQTNSRRVSARYCAEARRYLEAAQQRQEQQQHGDKTKDEVRKKGEKVVKAKESPSSSPQESPSSSPQMKTASNPRWADFDDESDNEEDTQSTFATSSSADENRVTSSEQESSSNPEISSNQGDI